jgi:hypothetical protein
VLNQFKSTGLVGDDTLDLYAFGGDLLMQGEIACIGMIVVGVWKILEYTSPQGAPAEVQTLAYSYNVSIRGMGNLFRYDNQHADWLHYGHRDEHHKHVFNFETGDELADSPLWIGADRWPTLGQVLEEIRDWYGHNRERLRDQYGFAADLQRLLRT